MTKDKFRILHSDLIHYVQCIEHDLRIIYAAMKPGDFAANLDDLEKATLGKIVKELEKLDYSDGHPDLSQSDYDLLDIIREKRNFWCHECYLNYVYIADDEERKERFSEICDMLEFDCRRTMELHAKIERIRLNKLKEYNRI